MLGYLLNPFIQVADTDGKPVPGAKIYVHLADTTTPATTYSDFEGTENTFPVLSDLLGNANVIADSGVLYDIVVNYPDDTLIFSKKGIGVFGSSGGGSGSVFHDDTLTGEGTLSAPLGLDSILKANINEAYSHSQDEGNPHGTTIGEIAGLRSELTEIESDVDAVEALIPSVASASNQLADKAFVNSSVTTNTATFRGTSAEGLTEEQFLAWANGLTKTNNDYVFWNTTDGNGNVLYKRYKYNGTSWIFEYALNNSSFTAAQWSAINSGITESDVDDIGYNTAARHTHSNKNLLDSYTQSNDSLADAVSKKHEHSNKSVLDNTNASYTIAEKSKLGGIQAGANKTTVDSALSSTSTNPVQNKVVNEALNGKANKNTYSVSNSSGAASCYKLAHHLGFETTAPGTQTRISYFARTGAGNSRQGTLYVERGTSGCNIRDVVGNITGDGLAGVKFQYTFVAELGRMRIYALLGVNASLSYCIESVDTSAWIITNAVSTDTYLTDAIVEFDTPTTREIDGSVVSANQLEESGIYIIKNATQANYMTDYSNLLILVDKMSDSSIYQHCFGRGYAMTYIGARSKVGSSWYPSWVKLQMEANISGNAATATNATNAANADKVDGKHIVVTSNYIPSAAVADTIYFVEG